MTPPVAAAVAEDMGPQHCEPASSVNAPWVRIEDLCGSGTWSGTVAGSACAAFAEQSGCDEQKGSPPRVCDLLQFPEEDGSSVVIAEANANGPGPAFLITQLLGSGGFGARQGGAWSGGSKASRVRQSFRTAALTRPLRCAGTVYAAEVLHSGSSGSVLLPVGTRVALKLDVEAELSEPDNPATLLPSARPHTRLQDLRAGCVLREAHAYARLHSSGRPTVQGAGLASSLLVPAFSFPFVTEQRVMHPRIKDASWQVCYALALPELGRSLHEAQRATWKGGQPLTLARACALGASMLDCLQRVHSRGLLHCDVKPENFLEERSGEKESSASPPSYGLVLIDFGLALECDYAHVDPAQGGHFWGTPAYASQRQVKGKRLSFRDGAHRASTRALPLRRRLPPGLRRKHRSRPLRFPNRPIPLSFPTLSRPPADCEAVFYVVAELAANEELPWALEPEDEPPEDEASCGGAPSAPGDDAFTRAPLTASGDSMRARDVLTMGRTLPWLSAPRVQALWSGAGAGITRPSSARSHLPCNACGVRCMSWGTMRCRTTDC